MDPQKIVTVDRDIATQKRKIEQALITGSNELAQIHVRRSSKADACDRRSRTPSVS
jgi:hypothetical protein